MIVLRLLPVFIQETDMASKKPNSVVRLIYCLFRVCEENISSSEA